MSDGLDPTKYHVLTKRMRLMILLSLLLFIIISLPIGAFFYYKFAVTRPSQTSKDNTIVISKGESVSQIADKLFQYDAVNSRLLFMIYVKTNKLENSMQAGVYNIPSGMNLAQLVQLLQAGKDDKSITFLEGWRVEEMARHAAKNFNKVDYEGFILEARNLEGKLFPDTYIFNVDITERDMIKVLNTTFEEKTRNIITPDKLSGSGLSKEEVIIIASIIEREINNPQDKPIVAGILLKRWKNGELVGADATTQYAIAAKRYGCAESSEEVCPKEQFAENVEWWPDDITLLELDSDSPYNTRKVVGLPPTPISNPGISAIEAVLNAQITGYNYYLSDKDGITRYAETLEQHNTNVATYLR